MATLSCWRGGLTFVVVAVGIAMGAGDASATRDDYLATLKSNGIYVSTPGAAPCFDYPDDGVNDCSKRFTTADDALSTGYWVCRELRTGRSSSSIADALHMADGLFLSKRNSAIVVNTAKAELCV